MNKAAFNKSRRLTESYPAFSWKLLLKLRLSPSHHAFITLSAAAQPVFSLACRLRTSSLWTWQLVAGLCLTSVTVSRPDPELLTQLPVFILDLPYHCGPSDDQDSPLRLATITTPGLLALLWCCRTEPLLVRPLPLMMMLPCLPPGSPSLREAPALAFANRDYSLFVIIHTKEIKKTTPHLPSKPLKSNLCIKP